MMMMVGVEEFVVCGVEFIGSDRVKRHREGSRFQVFVGCAKTNRTNIPAGLQGTVSRYFYRDFVSGTRSWE